MTAPLATFLDRNTMVYDRSYPHPIERVWDAVSTGEHLDAWLLPTSRVERRLGGACSFTWGGPPEEPISVGTVTAWEPPSSVRYSFQDGSWIGFDLSPLDGGASTRLRFTLHYLPVDPETQAADWPGGDFPVPGTAWQPGFLAGFHAMLDQLTGFFDGTWTMADQLASLERFAAGDEPEEHTRLIPTYREHVRATCPPA